MKKVIMSLTLIAILSVSGFTQASDPSASSSEMNSNTSLPKIIAPEQIVDLEKYNLVFVASDPKVIINEYIRSSDSLEHWTRMLTIRDYIGAKKIKNVLPAYVDQINALKLVPIDLYNDKEAKYKENVILTTILLDPSHTFSEVVVHMFIEDPKTKSVRSAVISERVYDVDRETLKEAWARRMKYMEDLRSINFEIYTDTNK